MQNQRMTKTATDRMEGIRKKGIPHKRWRDEVERDLT
jgi:hypothetical protein